MGLRARDVDRMAAVQEDYLPDLMTVERRTTVVNPAGASTPVPSYPYVDLPCAITPRVLRQLAEREVGAQVAGGIRWEIQVPRGTVIFMDDVLFVTNHETGQTKKMHVTGDLSSETWTTASVLNAMEIE